MSLAIATAHQQPDTAIYRATIPAGEPWLMEVKAGQTLRILDLEGNQAVDTLFYSVANPKERACAQESNTVRYALEKRYMHSCRDNYLRACVRDGRLGKGDIGPNINFFMNVPVTADGGLTFEDGISAPGKYVDLRAEMDVIVLISNCPQLNNPCNAYNPTPAELLVWN
jgi:uncharacterized protein YcgI (DUF1989 family)